MALPKYREIEFPLLRELFLRGGTTTPTATRNGDTVYDALAKHFRLSQDDLDAHFDRTPSGSYQNKWETMVRYARWKLVDAGFISRYYRGVWSLTERGKTRISAAISKCSQMRESARD